MIFDFLKRSGIKKQVKDHLQNFHKQFTDDQQKAIMISLLIVANADDEFHFKEQNYFKKIADQLDYKLEEDFVDEFFKMDRREVNIVLNSLDENQKSWYILTLFSMIHVDGKPLEVEFNLAKPYLEKMGIEHNQFKDVIRKSTLWKNSMPKDFLD